VPTFLFSLLALVADIMKWPVENFGLAFYLMVTVSVILAATMVWLRWPRGRGESAAWHEHTAAS